MGIFLKLFRTLVLCPKKRFFSLRVWGACYCKVAALVLGFTLEQDCMTKKREAFSVPQEPPNSFSIFMSCWYTHWPCTWCLFQALCSLSHPVYYGSFSWYWNAIASQSLVCPSLLSELQHHILICQLDVSINMWHEHSSSGPRLISLSPSASPLCSFFANLSTWHRGFPSGSAVKNLPAVQETACSAGACMRAKSLQLCSTLRDPMDHRLPGSSVHGILQAWILEWVVMSSSRGSSHPRDRTGISYISCIGRWVLYHQRHQGSPCSAPKWIQSLAWEDPLEKEMPNHFSITAWEIPRTEEPGRLGLQSMGLQESDTT